MANVYVRPIIFISLSDCTTFFPFRLGPKDSKDSTPIYLVHVNQNHWILANLEGEDGIIPIPSPFLVPNMVSRSTRGWSTFLKKGLELFNREKH
jgi:hypothetical protein